MKDTEIAWCDSTFNCWWGCAKVSPGCKHCYAETFSKRVGLNVWGADSDHRRFGDKHWNEPRKWNEAAAKSGKPWRVFCASMADVFEGRPEDEADRERLWKLIEETPHLTWLLLTKRPENMIRFAPWGPWPRNVWAGCTVEDQERADERIPHLLRVPAAVRFLSCEPLLGPVDFNRCDAWNPRDNPMFLDGIGWVIVGGESGHGARPFDLAWARSIVGQCKATGVAVFVKQLGAAPFVSFDSARESSGLPSGTRIAGGTPDGGLVPILRDRKGGDMAEWPEDLRVREFPAITK